MNYDEFCNVVGILDGSDDEIEDTNDDDGSDDNDLPVSPNAGKGFAPVSKPPSNTSNSVSNKPEASMSAADALALDMYDELRGKVWPLFDKLEKY